jgi:signal transduction histidine kinase
VGPEQPCDIDELRRLFLFEKLSDAQLLWLCEHGSVQEAGPGFLFREGEPARCFFVVLGGEVALYRRVGDDDVEISRTSQVGVYAGAWGAYLGDDASQAYRNSLRVLAPTRLYVLAAGDFRTLMTEWFPMAVHLLEGLFFGQQSSQRAVGQRERLLALGSLSAGLTHELNNPAAAAVRATSTLRERVAGMRQKLGMIAAGPFDRASLATLIQLQDEAVDRLQRSGASTDGTAPPAPGALETSDLEDDVAAWFDDHDLRGGWDLAPSFVQARIDPPWLDKVAALVDPEVLEGAVRWIAYSLETEQLMAEIEDATQRISTLVGAAKQYSQIGRAPFQLVDVHELLDSTLVMLDHRLGTGIEVVRHYDHTLPQVHVYAAELNQVWTNIVENAAHAMGAGGTHGGHGTLTVTTRRAGDAATGTAPDAVEVEIADTGKGIPADVLPRIFEPFFTTKPVGEGTGLGLDISWRIVVNKHHGDLSVTSRPGDTRFVVRLPVGADAPPAD